MGVLALIWTNPLGRKIVAVVGIAAVVLLLWLGFARHYISIGDRKGQTKANAAADVATEQTHAGDRTQTAQQLAAADLDIRAAHDKADAAQLAAARLQGQYDALQRQVNADRQRVAALPAGDVHPYTVEKLALRAPGDATPGYTVAEERRIAELVTIAPALDGLLQKSQERMDKLEARIDAMTVEISAQGKKYDALAGYTTRLEGYYAEVWNRTPKKKPAWKCLKLWSCGKTTLAVPDPAELTGKRPQ